MTLDRTQQPLVRPMAPFVIPEPVEHRMPNEIPVHVFRAGEEEVVRLDIMLRGGIWEQSQPLQATFTSRMLREGTKRFSSADIAEQLDYYGAWLDVSASMNYSFVTLYTLTKYFAPTLALVTSMLTEPLFPEKEFQVVVDGNRQQYLVNREKVDVIARRKLNQLLFGLSHPCGRYAELEDYDRLTTEALRTMHRRYYNIHNCICYLSGHVTDEILHVLDEELGAEAWGDGEKALPITDILPPSNTVQTLFVERSDAMQSAIRMGCFSIDCTHPDYLKTRLLITLFGGYFGSRLMKNIREDKGYTYGISSGMVAYPFRNMIIVSTQAANEYARSVVTEVGREIDRLQQERVADEELTMVKNYTMGDMCRSYESPFSLADAYIFLETAGLPRDFFRRSQEAVLDATADELRDLACKYLRKESFTEVIAGKKCAEEFAT